jgi:hypothetical protein
VAPRFAARRHRYAQRRVIALALLAPIRGMLFFLAQAIHDPAQGLGFDALFAPQRPSLFVLCPGIVQFFMCWRKASPSRSMKVL